MKTNTKSGYYYPNRLSLGIFNSLIEDTGKNGLNAILSLAHLRNYINNYPSDNMEREFDFADFSAIRTALDEMYGEQGGSVFVKRAGRITFAQSLSKYGALTGVRDTTFRSLPSQIRVKIGIQALARIFSQISDQLTTVEEEETHFRYIVHRCPECWGRSLTSEPICSFGAGLLEEGLNTFSGGTDFRVNETRCIAKGDTVCEYSIDKSPVLE